MVTPFVGIRQKAIAVLLSVAVLATIISAVAVAAPAQARESVPESSGGLAREAFGNVPGGRTVPAEEAVPGLANERKDRSAPASPGGRVGPVEKVPGFKNFSNPAVSGAKVSESFKAYNHEDPFGINEYIVPRNLDEAFELSFGGHDVGTGANGLDFSLTRRGSETAAEAVEIGEGVYYDDPDKQVGTYTQQLGDGSNIILEVLASPEAPSVYEYALELPEGFSLSINAEGGADILNASGVPNGVSAAAPWAFDSAGVAVPVSYSVGDGNVLEFTVDHLSGDYAYPIVADPRWLRGSWWEACAGQLGFNLAVVTIPLSVYGPGGIATGLALGFATTWATCDD